MFSGLTNQVSSWMSKKPEDGGTPTSTEEKVASPIAEEIDPNLDGEAKKEARLLHMSTSGRLKRWREFWMGSVKDEPCPANSALPKFGLEQVILPFSILGAGLIISIILLGMEETFKKLFPHHHGHGHFSDVSSLQQLAKQSAEKKKNKKKSVDTKKEAPKFEFIR